MSLYHISLYVRGVNSAGACDSCNWTTINNVVIVIKQIFIRVPPLSLVISHYIN